MIDSSRLDIKLGSYAVGPAVALEDTMWLPRVQTYRRTLGARMVAFDKAAAEKKIPNGDFHISRKVDGEFSMLIYSDEQAILVNPGGTVRVGLPLLDEAAAILKKAGIRSAMIPGELHVRHSDGRRARVHDVSRIARKPENQAQVDSLCFAAFDLLSLDDEDWAQPYAETYQWLTDTLDGGDRVQPVETVVGKGSQAVLRQFGQWVDEEEGEGVVARSDEQGWYKVKPRHTLDVCVIGFAEGTDDRVGMLHDLLLGIYRQDGSVQVLGRVGGGFSDDERRDLLTDLKDMVVDSEYAEINSDRVAYTMVRPEWVIEISCLDLISHTTRGATIDRMVLEWDEKDKTWRTTRRLPLCSVISPQYQRIRDDKSPGSEDCRFSQLTDLVEIELADATSEDLQLPQSEVLKRQVRVKELKGRQMVRKLMMWKTNKEQITRGEFPAYVVHLTDFSPNRKDPMKREIRVSDDKDQIEVLYHQLFDKYLDVGGWSDPLDGEAAPAPAPAKKKSAAAKKTASKKTAVKKKVAAVAEADSSASEEKPESTKKKAPAKKAASKKKAATAKKKSTTVKKKAAATKKKASAPAKKKTAAKKKPPAKKAPAKKASAKKKAPTKKKSASKKAAKKKAK